MGRGGRGDGMWAMWAMEGTGAMEGTVIERV